MAVTTVSEVEQRGRGDDHVGSEDGRRGHEVVAVEAAEPLAGFEDGADEDFETVEGTSEVGTIADCGSGSLPTTHQSEHGLDVGGAHHVVGVIALSSVEDDSGSLFDGFRESFVVLFHGDSDRDSLVEHERFVFRSGASEQLDDFGVDFVREFSDCLLREDVTEVEAHFGLGLESGHLVEVDSDTTRFGFEGDAFDFHAKGREVVCGDADLVIEIFDLDDAGSTGDFDFASGCVDDFDGSTGFGTNEFGSVGSGDRSPSEESFAFFTDFDEFSDCLGGVVDASIGHLAKGERVIEDVTFFDTAFVGKGDEADVLNRFC